MEYYKLKKAKVYTKLMFKKQKWTKMNNFLKEVKR